MIATILGGGHETVHNRAGANMPGGVATALSTSRGGIEGSRLGLFEVDEAWLGRSRPCSPRIVVLGNLFRDQLDRYGELERLADEWAEVVARSAGRQLRAQRRRSARRRPRARSRGTAARANHVLRGRGSLPCAAGSSSTPSTRSIAGAAAPSTPTKSRTSDISVTTACPNCGNPRPAPSVAATRVELLGMSGTRVSITTPAGELELSLSLPGLYNVYNALAATACCLELEIPLDGSRGASSPRRPPSAGRSGSRSTATSWRSF